MFCFNPYPFDPYPFFIGKINQIESQYCLYGTVFHCKKALDSFKLVFETTPDYIAIGGYWI